MNSLALRMKGMTCRLKEDLGPFRKGDALYCFEVERNGKVWLYLPHDWHGVRQICMSHETAVKLLVRDY